MLRWLAKVVVVFAGGLFAASAHAQVAHSAAFVAQTVPSFIALQTATPVSITMRNTGTATWRTADGDVFLATQEPQDNFYWCIQGNRYGSVSGNRVLPPQDVAPGQTVTFDFIVKPLGCGFAATAPFRFRMLSQRFGTFGELTPDPKVDVSTAAEYVSQRVPAKVPAGSPIQVSVTFRNTTNTTWEKSAGFTLRPAVQADRDLWGLDRVSLPDDVEAGSEVTFEFAVTAPSTPGTYSFQWQMNTPAGVPFGGLSAGAQVSVVAAGPPNYEGLWWNSPAGSEAGWGVNFAHQDDVIFASWFTYDLFGKGWWLVMTASQTSEQIFEGTWFEVTGPPFNAVPFNPGQVRTNPVGRGAIVFTDNDNATFSYTVNGVPQTKSITRQVFGPLPTCTFGLLPDPAAAYNYQDLWWAAPAASEAGWGINLTQQGQTIFATWFTFDLDRTPMWLVVTATRIESDTYEGALYRTTGPPFNAVPFDPTRVVATEVGTATFTFKDGNNATFDYTVNDITQSKAITRQVFRSPGSVCQ